MVKTIVLYIFGFVLVEFIVVHVGHRGRTDRRRAVKGPRGWEFIALLIMTLAGSPAEAGNYVLTFGKQYEVCRVFADNLKSFGDLPQGILDWPINPKFKSLRKPKWEDLDPKDNIGAIEKWAKETRVAFGVQPPEIIAKKWGELRENILSNSVALQETRLDVNNDGVKERLFRIHTPGTPAPDWEYGWHWSYFIVTDFGEIDSRTNNMYSPLDAFFFNGRTFFAQNLFPKFYPHLVIVEYIQPLADLDVFGINQICHFGHKNGGGK